MKSFCLRLVLLLGFAAGLVGPVQAAIDTYEFSDEQTRERFYQLGHELRCPKCQNQSLGDSNSPIANDLRREVYRLLNEGKSDQEIKEYLVSRYGEYILYRPELAGHTLMLWLAPLGLLFVGLGVVLLLVRRRRRAPQAVKLDAAEQEKLNELLKKTG